MNTKKIGNIGEAKVLASFVELGIPVYLPFGDNERVDLIAEFDNKLNRIQIKTALKAENGVVKFDVTSSTAHRKQGVKHKYTSDEIDYFALYSIARDKVYLVCNDFETPPSAINIRYELPKNNQTKGIRFEGDYLLKNVLCVETLHEAPKDE